MIKRLITFIILIHLPQLLADDAWVMHTIDKSSNGADGVRLADVNKDGRMDVTTGWEEGGQIRVCLQPERSDVRKPWPAVRVGSVKSPEDAVFTDVNGDGWLDVVSCCEGKQQSVFFHRNPGGSRLMEPSAWKTEVLPASVRGSRWMFCQPLPDGRLAFGSKDPNGQIAIYDSQDQQIRQIRRCGWIMSLRSFDIDCDGHPDIVYSDRKGKVCGVGWLQNPGARDAPWKDHLIGGRDMEVMFLDLSTTPEPLRVVCNTRNGCLLDMTPTNDVTMPWATTQIPHPPRAGAGKAVAICDVDQDGRQDLVCTCGLAEQKFGVFWLEQSAAGHHAGAWKFHDVSGTEIGVKFDRIEMLDLDGDGDKDLLTCEERDNLGVIWYENPHK